MVKRALIVAVVALAAAMSLVIVAGVSGQHQSPPDSGAESGVTQLQTPTPTPSPDDGAYEPEPEPQVVEKKQEPLITGERVFWLVMASLVAAWTILIGLLYLFWKVIKREGNSAGVERLGRPAIEGITLVMVVVAVIILGIQAVIGDQGVVAILSSIVGYTLGRVVGRGQTDGNGGRTETVTGEGGGGTQEAGGGGEGGGSGGEAGSGTAGDGQGDGDGGEGSGEAGGGGAVTPEVRE